MEQTDPIVFGYAPIAHESDFKSIGIVRKSYWDSNGYLSEVMDDEMKKIMRDNNFYEVMENIYEYYPSVKEEYMRLKEFLSKTPEEQENIKKLIADGPLAFEEKIKELESIGLIYIQDITDFLTTCFE